MAAAFGAMADSLREKAALAEAIAGGDLSRDVEPRSERDALGHAFQHDDRAPARDGRRGLAAPRAR